MRRVLGLDIGTQGTKALLYDGEEGRIVARSQASYGLEAREDGTRTQEARVWIEAIRQCCADLGAEKLATVQAVGVSGQQHGFVAVDEAGQVLAPSRLWCDTATTLECNELETAFGGREALIRELGNPILPGYTASKILRLRKDDPGAYAQLRWILLPHDYVNFVLTGKATMEYGDASGTGLLDVRNRRWHAGMLKALDPARDLSSCLPPLLGHEETAGLVSPSASKLTGLPAGIPVSVGGGDNMMAAIGTGCVSPGSVTASLGTSGTLFAFAATPIVDPAGSLAAFCSSTGGWLPLLCTMNCTVATETFRAILGVDLKELNTLAAKAQPGAGGLTLLPFFNGERTPDLPHGQGCLLGMTSLNATRENVLRAAMESAIFGLRAGLGLLEGLGTKPTAITLTGGGAGSPLWRSIAAGIFGLPVRVPEETESAALGAALQALALVEPGRPGIAALVGSHVRFAVGSEAEPAYGHSYDEAYGRYSGWVETLRGRFA
jgi:xylulokinase